MVLVLMGSLVLASLEIAAMGALLLLLQLFAGSGGQPSIFVSLATALGADSQRAQVVLLAGIVLGIFVVKAAVGLLFRRWVISFMQRTQAETAVRLLSCYLNGPYWRVLSRNSADLVRTMYDGTASAYGQVVSSLIQIAVEVATIVAVLGFLMFTMPVPTAAALVFFAVSVWGLNRFIKGRAEAAGEELVTAGTVAYQSMLQALAGAKEIKVRRTQGQFIDEFAEARMNSARAGASAAFLGEAPRFVLEVLFIVAILLVSVLVIFTEQPQETLPLIALFVAAGVRLLPSAVRVVAMSSAIRAGQPQMLAVISDLLYEIEPEESLVAAQRRERWDLNSSLAIEDVRFTYPATDEAVLKGVSLSIPAGTSLAIVGTSGAGKSTLVDILLGLYTPTAGRILVDGMPLEGRVPQWQRSIGLVPQDVFLLDDTLRRNVTLGSPSREGDDGVLRALSKAHLDSFVAALPDGLDTRLGERGSRVSGGQRQRIGIARALFINPSLLVLDEATSALDNDAENKITETLSSLRGALTTVVVAHRLSTVRHCDQIAFLDGGAVAASGTFDEVVNSNAAFARLVELGRL